MFRKEEIKELLIFTRGEKKGIIVLLILVILVILVNQFSYLFIPENENDFTDFKTEIAEFEKSLVPKEDKFDYDSNHSEKYDTIQLFIFNPNSCTNGEWKLLGLSEKQIKIINNWQNKGGKFQYKSDLKRIYGISEFQFQKLYSFIDLPDKKTYSQNEIYKDFKNKKNKNFENTIPEVKNYFEFNPNEISDIEWQSLGFSVKQISTIRNYLTKGGKFYKKEDLKKIYGIKDFQYDRIKEYIKLPGNNIVKKDGKEIKSNAKVDINNLSTEEMKAYGKFWRYNATRIVKYRNLLGGFYKKEQLLEVYGIKREYYLKVADDIIIDKSKIQKIHLNFAEVSELGRHPYITFKEAEKVLDYRNKKGAFSNLNILKEKKLIPIEVFNKISPYLKIK